MATNTKQHSDPGRRLRLEVHPIGRILLPASGELERRCDARQQIEGNRQAGSEQRYRRHPRREDLPRPDGQSGQRQVIAPRREERLPDQQRRQTGDRSEHHQQRQLVRHGRGAKSVGRRQLGQDAVFPRILRHGRAFS